MNSFGSRFHKALKVRGGLRLDVYARILCTGIGNPVEEVGQPLLHGHKGTFNEDDRWEGWNQGSHRSQSKIRFFWVGDTQRRAWAY
jgi:hypothetical protein